MGVTGPGAAWWDQGEGRTCLGTGCCGFPGSSSALCPCHRQVFGEGDGGGELEMHFSKSLKNNPKKS